jgi:YHS domain-containing protein
MLRLVLLVLLVIFIARAFWRVVDGVVEGVSGRRRSSRTPASGVPMARDPVCGTFVVPDRAVTLIDGRQRLFFCSTACRDRYRARTA